MLCAAGLPKKLWAEAVHTAAYVLNRTSKSNETGKTPYEEAWTGKQFDITGLKIFGNPVYVHVPKEKRTKWDPKGEKAIMVGYEENVIAIPPKEKPNINTNRNNSFYFILRCY